MLDMHTGANQTKPTMLAHFPPYQISAFMSDVHVQMFNVQMH